MTFTATDEELIEAFRQGLIDGPHPENQKARDAYSFGRQVRNRRKQDALPQFSIPFECHYVQREIVNLSANSVDEAIDQVRSRLADRPPFPIERLEIHRSKVQRLVEVEPFYYETRPLEEGDDA